MIEDGIIEADRARTIDALAKLVAVALKRLGEGGVLRLGVERHDGNILITLRPIAARVSASSAGDDESRGGLALLIARGLLAAQNAKVTTEVSPEGPRTVVTFPEKV
jgi:hypothetical protein